MNEVNSKGISTNFLSAYVCIEIPTRGEITCKPCHPCEVPIHANGWVIGIKKEKLYFTV